MTLSDWDEKLTAQPESSNDRKKFGFHMKQGAEACLVLCDHVDACNDLKVVLLHYTTVLQSYCGESGESWLMSSLFTCLLYKGYLLWRRHGSLVAAVTALGLHQESETSDRLPFIVSEMRKRLFIVIYHHDKLRATFMGRPPLLSRRYCTCATLLDLSEELIMATEESVALARSKLDANGWNTSGEVHPATLARVRLPYCPRLSC